MEKFLSCDWGTSNFRLRLVESKNLTVVAAVINKQGIAATFDLWKEQKKNERLIFYRAFIQQYIKALEQKTNASLKNIPLIISGMASSTIGMMELPYKQLPFTANGSDLQVHTIKSDDSFPHSMFIISGAKTDNDVMRGEETKVVGCVEATDNAEQLLILPGTHSKHITIKEGKAVAFATYMTGEFFNLLSQKSILAGSVKEGAAWQTGDNKKAFRKGVADSVKFDLLHSCFLIRTNELFQKLTKEENYYYLSGLLIGTELKEVKAQDHQKIVLVADETLKSYYQTAFAILNKSENMTTLNGDEALLKGQLKIYHYHRLQ